MKKKFVFLSVLVLSIIILMKTSYAQDIKRINLKLTGGLGTWSGGDINEFLEDFNDQIEDIAAILGGRTSGSFENINWGFDLEGEFVLDLGKNIGVGLGVGYLHRKKESIGEILIPYDYTQSIKIAPIFTAIPVTLSGYYYFPVAARLNAFVKAGVGYYIGECQYTMRQDTKIGDVSFAWETVEGESSANSFGIHGGLGLEFNFSEKVSFFFEGMGKHAVLKNWDVETQYSHYQGESFKETGTWYYYEQYEGMTGKYYKNIGVHNQEPSAWYLKNVREAKISYSGISFRTGIKISFGKSSPQ